MIAAWMDCSSALPGFQDPLGDEVAAANSLAGAERVRALLAVVDPALAADDAVVELVQGQCGRFAGHPASG